MFPAVKHSNLCEKLKIGEWPTESAFLVSALFLELIFPSWIATGKLRCFGEAALSSPKRDSSGGLDVLGFFTKHLLLT